LMCSSQRNGNDKGLAAGAHRWTGRIAAALLAGVLMAGAASLGGAVGDRLERHGGPVIARFEGLGIFVPSHEVVHHRRPHAAQPS
jgi:hypothetical protein